MDTTTRFTFGGVLDAYHSDGFDMNKSSPTRLRTAGFANSSLNIGNSLASRLCPSQLAITVITTFSALVLFYWIYISVRNSYLVTVL